MNNREAISARREGLKKDREQLRARFESGMNSSALLRAQSQLVDRFLRQAWSFCRMAPTHALVAVGGFGRGELYPHSDVDVLILLPVSANDVNVEKIQEFVSMLWDIGLEIGHSVRTLEQCQEEANADITVRTSLLEARHVAGNASLARQLRSDCARNFDQRAFLHGKRMEQDQRHVRYHDSPYSLEPNLKEAPGGLRDLQMIRWIALACDLGRDWKDLELRGFITHTEALEARRTERFLQLLRIKLHYQAGRREDRLLFDFQDTLARQLGYRPTIAKRASEQLMQKYYRSAKTITQLNTLLLQNLEAALIGKVEVTETPINPRFCKRRERLDVVTENVFHENPHAILEAFALMQRHPDLKGMTARTLRGLLRSRPLIDQRFRGDDQNKLNFLSIFKADRGIVHELRRMNQYGILGAYLPAFRKIVGQMQHDLFHVYTVDQHILMVVRNIRRFTMAEFSHEYPLCSRLIAGFEKSWLLYIAALFHDIAKGRGGDHSQLGRIDARRFCNSHFMEEDDTDLVVFLVEHHLTMSSVAQKQDLSDPSVIRSFASTVKTERRLVALYLMTVADIRGTSPKVWNAWKAKLLEDLFHFTDRLLRGEDVGFDNSIREKQSEARRLLTLYGLPKNAHEAFWNHLDVPYFLRHDAQEMAWQTRNIYRHLNSDAPVVRARLSPVGEGLQVLIYVRDQPHLFARICGFFGSIGYNIVDAKIHTTRHGYALDSFQVMGPSAHDYRKMIASIDRDLAATLAAPEDLPVPVRGRISRQLRHFPIQAEVQIRPDERGQYHLLSITAGDRPGLLYSVAWTLSRFGIDLHMAKIGTLGGRAEDVFVISGAALANSRAILLLEQDLLEILTPEPPMRAVA